MEKTPSVEPVLRSRLLPRISFRVLLILTSLCACVAALARAAGTGAAMAQGILAGVGFVGAILAGFAVMFLLAWSTTLFHSQRRMVGLVLLFCSLVILVLVATGLNVVVDSFVNGHTFLIFFGLAVTLMYIPPRTANEDRDNPFAEGQLPPQILPPRERRE